MKALITSFALIGAILLVGTWLIIQRHETETARVLLATESERRLHADAERRRLQEQAAAAEMRAAAADRDTAELLTAVESLRTADTTAQRSASQPLPQTREAALLAAEEMVKKFEESLRARPGYRPFQPADESLFDEESRKRIDRTRSEAQSRGAQVFVVRLSNGSPWTIVVEPLASGPIAKMMPFLTPADWNVLDERWGIATAEHALLNPPKIPQKNNE